MELTFWNAFNVLVVATVILLGFFISYYLMAVKNNFPPGIATGFKHMAQGFLLLLGVSAISILGGLIGLLPLGRLNTLSMLMLPSLIWALLLLYQGARRLVKESAKAKMAGKGGKAFA